MSRHRRPDLIQIPLQLHEDTPTVTELWRIQECIEKRGITKKCGSGEGVKLFLCLRSCPDLIYCHIKLHENIPNGY